jgi:hypothetical protein
MQGIVLFIWLKSTVYVSSMQGIVLFIWLKSTVYVCSMQGIVFIYDYCRAVG